VHIGHLLFPRVTQLDLTGPLQVLSRVPDATVQVVARSLDAAPTDCAFSMLPTVTFDECPPLDVLVVPGGAGVVDVLGDRATMTFMRSQVATAYFLSVCTGSFLLGAAGLLKGKRATTHWAYHDLLREVGAIPVRARVVVDDSVVSSAGVTAGLDAAFTLITQLRGAEISRAIQLALEYDPAPALQGGSPEKATPDLLNRVRSDYGPRLQALRAALAAQRIEDRHTTGATSNFQDAE
jgi:cyclohexyl-isocyanide hydratase